MGWLHVNILQDYVPPTNKDHVEIHVSGGEPEIEKMVTYAHIITGDQIRSNDWS